MSGAEALVSGPTTTCEICGRAVELEGGVSYARSGQGAAAIEAEELRHCWSCKRRGCPDCLRTVEERADDFFIDLLTCQDCLDKESAPAPGEH